MKLEKMVKVRDNNPKRTMDLKYEIGQKEKRMAEIMEKCEAEKRARTAEEKTEWRKLKDELNELKEELNDLEDYHADMAKRGKPVRANQIEDADDNNPTFTIQERSKPIGQMSDWYLRNNEVPEALQKITPGDYIRARISGPKTDLEKRAINTGTDSEGGFYVPEVLMAKIMDNVRAKSHVLSSGAQTILLDAKNQSMAKIVGDPTAAWVAENGDITASDPTFASVDWTAKKLVARVDASGEWLQDAVNAGRALQLTLEGSLAGELDRAALIGSGTGEEPEGIFSYSNVNTYSMGTNGAAITSYDSFLEAIKLMYDDNSETPNTAIMAPRTWLTLNKFKDSTNQPLQLPPAIRDMAFKQTSKIPVNQTQGSASTASCIFLGGFENLYLGLRMQLEIIRVPLLMATKYQMSYLAVMRGDWQPLREQAFGVIKGIIP